MVRGMLDEEGNPKSTQPEPLPASNDECEVEENYASGKVIHANGGQGRSTTYIGATHFMAMLDDVCTSVFFFVHHLQAVKRKSVVRWLTWVSEITDRRPQELL